MTARFSILVGVSSDPQAREDKASIPDQIKTCRYAINQLEGVEVAVYQMDGYSRSGYDSLSDAMNDIPPLKDAILAAQQNQYDVLIMDHFDRLGDLGKMIHNRFKKLKKQLYSARESGRIQDPDKYNPHEDEATDMLISMQGIKQNYRINKIIRNFVIGVDTRIESGRYSRAHGYGYIKVNTQGDIEPDPIVSNLLITLKDKFFDGLSLRELARLAGASGVPPPRGATWEKSTIRYILCNPFYTGRVFKDRWKVTGRRMGPSGKLYETKVYNPNAKLYPGSHKPLWTWNEHLQIMEEIEARYRKTARHHPRAFTGLLICSVCGKRLRFKGWKYICRPGKDHIGLPETKANAEIGQAIVQALKDYDESTAAPHSVDTSRAAIAALEKQIAKVQRVWLEGDIYTDDQARATIHDLKERIKALEAGQVETERQQAQREQWNTNRKKILPMIDRLPEILMTGDAKESNLYLRKIVRCVEVTPDHKYTVHS